MTELPDGTVTSSPAETKIFQGLDDDFGLKGPNHHLGPEYEHLFRAKKSIVYGETFLRNFKFYAKTLTKLHDLTVPVSPYYQSWPGSVMDVNRLRIRILVLGPFGFGSGS